MDRKTEKDEFLIRKEPFGVSGAHQNQKQWISRLRKLKNSLGQACNNEIVAKYKSKVQTGMPHHQSLAANKECMQNGACLKASQIFLALHSGMLDGAKTNALAIRLHIMYNPSILPLSLGIERLTSLIRKWIGLW